MPVFISKGRKVVFTNVDHQNGIIALNDGKIIEEIRVLIKEGRGGITEISEDSYHGWRKKKPKNLLPMYREEIGQQTARDKAVQRVLERDAAAAAEANASGIPPEIDTTGVPFQSPNQIRPTARRT